MGKRIGIDFGTASSRVAVMEGGVPRIIRNKQGAPGTPSTVSFPDVGEPLIGESAKRHGLIHPRNVVSGVKRLIGIKYGSPEVDWARSSLSCELVEVPNGDAHVRVGSAVRSPAEIASHILRSLKASAEEYLGEAVDEATIAVPSHFSQVQRQAVKDAGLIAGLKVSLLIGEATAAALTYGSENLGSNGQFVAVLGLGAGSFDLAILELADGLFQVRAVGGDIWLGGEDFDQGIIEWLIAEFQEEAGIDLRQDRVALQRLKEAAERAKCELSTEPETEIVVPFVSAEASNPKHLKAVLTRQMYDDLTCELVEWTMDVCGQCLSDAGMRPEQIDEVLLVGGQSRSPKFREMVRKVFGRTPKRAAHDGVVAMGAAIRAGIAEGEVKDLVLLDVIPHTLGIETEDGTFTPLIERNSTISTRRSRVFSPAAADRSRFEVHVLEGEGEAAADNLSLARFEITDLPPTPLGAPEVEVTFEVDVRGIVSVSATDQATGRALGMTIHPSGGLSPAEVGRLLAETRARESEERQQREKEDVIRQLDALVANTTRSVQGLEGKLTPEEQQRILGAVEEASRVKARPEASLDELKEVFADMERAAQNIWQAMLRR